MYFDYAATTPMDNEIIELYVKIQKEYFANTTSLHTLGQTSNNIYIQMKKEICDVLRVQDEVIFTSNATEANNLAILGLVEGKKGKLITSKIEHPSIYEIFKKLEIDGYEVVYLDVDNRGVINLQQLKNEMNKDVLLVSVMWVNNIMGAIQPIKEVVDIVKAYPKCKIHVDAVQGICKIKPDFNFSDLDSFTFSAHKFYGPKGIGCLIYKSSLDLHKRLFGSNAQNGIKPGTIDLGLITCCAKALKKYYNKQSENYEYVKKLKEYIVNNINNNKITINSYEGSPYIINISLKDILGETLVHKLENNKIYVSTGSSCSSKLLKPEKTIFAMTNNENAAKNTIRISLSHLTTNEEVEKLIQTLNNL